jgi:hypothetical protein
MRVLRRRRSGVPGLGKAGARSHARKERCGRKCAKQSL